MATSCATQTVNGFAEQEPVITDFESPYFLNPETDYVYKAHIAVYGRDFGGIFIVKKINDTTHRVAFTTEFGNKLFDFELSGSEFKVNYILEELDKKIIVNTLRKDFALLLKMNHQVMGQYENSEYTVYKSKDGRRYNYLFIDKKNEHLVKLVNATKAKEKVIISYVPNGNEPPEKIVIEHKNINLKIALDYINN